MIGRLLLCLILIAPLAHGAEPTAEDIARRLELIQAKREKVFSDYRLGELMMKNAALEDGALKAEEDALKAKLTAVKDKKSGG